MAHYDCTNCDARHGIAWGYCEECTPKQVLDAREEVKRLSDKLRDVVVLCDVEEVTTLMGRLREARGLHNRLQAELRPKRGV